MPGTQSNKDRAVDFLQMIIAGKIREAYEQYTATDFRHHNPYFKGDAESLLAGMVEDEKQFPAKVCEVQRALQDGDLVAVHSRLRHSPAEGFMAVVHIFRFEDGRIAEFWDIAQAAPNPIVNENGMF